MGKRNFTRGRMSRTLFLKREKRVKDEGGRKTPQKLTEKGKEIVNRARGVSWVDCTIQPQGALC